MQLTQLSLTNFRSLVRLETDVPDGVIMLVGSNAQGKTSVLEAIYFLATLASFMADSDRQLVNFIEGRKQLGVGRIVAEISKGGRSHRLEVRLIKEKTRNGSERARKEVLLDGVKKKSNEFIGMFNAVFFLPQMLRVVDGSPSNRRRYLDMLISQVVPHYARHLSEYRAVVTQRNALLRSLSERGGDHKQLEFWDERLVKHGTQIITDRIHAIQQINTLAGRVHHELTDGREVLHLDYQPAFDPIPQPDNQPTLLAAPVDRSGIAPDKIEQRFLQALAANRREEIRRGMTTIGPHRDELRFQSNGIDLGTYGSRGQIRTTMLTMKIAEVDWMKEQTGEWPVLLLDEVLAELDAVRRADLAGRLTNAEQVILTTTDLNLFPPDFVANTRVWHIEGGQLKK